MRDKDISVLTKIYNHANSIIEYTENCQSLEEFESNSIKDIHWNEIYGMRNRIVHGYDSLVMNVIWSTINEDIPKLKEKLKDFLGL